MVINKNKTNVIIFNKSRNWDFPPELHFNDGTQIEYVSETKLVGLILTEDLKWRRNTEYICQKARQKLWMLRRMLSLDLDIYKMYDVYTKEVRSMVELAVPVWHPGITKNQSEDIERIQKVSFKIILRNQYSTYQQACIIFSAQTLHFRREKLCLNFAQKNLKSDQTLFTKLNSNTKSTDVVREYKSNHGRFQKTSLPFMSKLLNNDAKKSQ